MNPPISGLSCWLYLRSSPRFYHSTCHCHIALVPLVKLVYPPHFMGGDKFGLVRHDQNIRSYLSRQMVFRHSMFPLFKSERWLWIPMKSADSNLYLQISKLKSIDFIRIFNFNEICGFIVDFMKLAYMRFRPVIKWDISNKRLTRHNTRVIKITTPDIQLFYAIWES